jgi:anti-anti-sigma regulatory factor
MRTLTGDLTVSYAVRGKTTVVTVGGTVDDQGRRLLTEGLEAALGLRGRGPIVVDVSTVLVLEPATMLCIAAVAREAAKAGRDVSVRI